MGAAILNEHDDPVSGALSLLSARYHYNHWIFSKIRDHIGNNILEVGAGIGNITDFLMNKPKLTLIEPDQNFIEFLKRKYSFRTPESFKIYSLRVEDIPASPLARTRFDTIICLNVLEHIKKDAEALKNMLALLEPQGHLILLVPALPGIYGTLDGAFGHFRRYTRTSLRTLIQKMPLYVKECSYMNFLGVFGWFVNGILFHRDQLPQAQTKLFDSIVPALSALERIIPPPAGLSAILIAQKF